MPSYVPQAMAQAATIEAAIEAATGLDVRFWIAAAFFAAAIVTLIIVGVRALAIPRRNVVRLARYRRARAKGMRR